MTVLADDDTKIMPRDLGARSLQGSRLSVSAYRTPFADASVWFEPVEDRVVIFELMWHSTELPPGKRFWAVWTPDDGWRLGRAVLDDEVGAPRGTPMGRRALAAEALRFIRRRLPPDARLEPALADLDDAAAL